MAAAGRPIPIHVCVDTGIGRVGVPFREAAALIRDLASRKGVRIAGTMMTFTEDPAFDREQLGASSRLTGESTVAGIALGRLHAASSYTLFQHGDETFFDMVRPGMALLGVYPDAKFKAMRHPRRCGRRWRCACAGAYVKQLAAGDSAGYERAYIAKKDTWIATLPVGPRRWLAARRREGRAGSHQRQASIPSSRRCRQATRSSKSATRRR